MKNKSVQNCRFVHHAKFHCIMTTLNRLFKIELERGGGLEKSRIILGGGKDIWNLILRGGWDNFRGREGYCVI